MIWRDLFVSCLGFEGFDREIYVFKVCGKFFVGYFIYRFVFLVFVMGWL